MTLSPEDHKNFMLKLEDLIDDSDAAIAEVSQEEAVEFLDGLVSYATSLRDGLLSDIARREADQQNARENYTVGPYGPEISGEEGP